MYTYLLPCILLIATAAYFGGRSRANTLAETSGGMRALHSLPSHYGMLTLLSFALPALFIFAVGRIIEGTIITSLVVKSLPVELQQLSANQLSLVINEVKNIVFSGFAAHTAAPAIQAAVAGGQGLYVLARTSNPDGGTIQLADAGGATVAQHVVDTMTFNRRTS